MNYVALSLALMLASAVQSTDEPTAQARRYMTCPGSERLAKAANVSWKPEKSALSDHRRLRRSLGVAMPQGGTRILWYANGGDLATTTFSVIALRRPDGVWHVNGVGQKQIWIKGAAPTRLDTMDRDLSPSESTQLDAMISDRCLLDGPTFQRDPTIAAGGLIMTLEVETPGQDWVGGWWGAPTKQEEAITALIGTH